MRGRFHSYLRAAARLGRRRIFVLLALVMVLGVAPACSDDGGGEEVAAEAGDGSQESPRARRKKKKEQQKAPKTPAVDASELPKIDYVYNPVARRDPFKSDLVVQPPLNEVPTTPLQKYDLDQYKLVAVIWGTSNAVAMVEDPEGNGHFIRTGTLIGRNWGKVARINESSVVVAEEYRDFTGQLNVNEIVLELPEASGVKKR